jgi:AcrR family transcriptional regulator
MIYYYFKGKEGLYRAVLEKAYSEIRSLDSHEGIEDAEPAEAIRRIIEITFDYDEMHPFFVSLVSVENVHQGQNIARLPSIKKRNASVIRVLTSILERGAKQGVFRSDVSALDLHLADQRVLYFPRLEPLHVRDDLRHRSVRSGDPQPPQEDARRGGAALPRARRKT